MNDHKLALVKAKGEFVWHSHEDTDGFFLGLRGRITIQPRDPDPDHDPDPDPDPDPDHDNDPDVELGEGELFVVPRRVEHCPRADYEAHVLLIGPRGAVNTGQAGELTAAEIEI
jgi:mannose-6-phosphate isomerase-like protein (cupin superfamily)